MADDKTELEKPAVEEAALVRPGYPRAVGYPDAYGYSSSYGYGEGAEKMNPREIWRIVRKRKGLVAVIVAIACTIVTVEAFRNKSIYQASTTIEIEKENRTLVRTGDVVIQTDEGDDNYFLPINMKTKIRVIQSRPVLEDVVVGLHLDQNPKFLDVSGKKSVWDAMRAIGGKFHPGEAPAGPPPVPEPPTLKLDGISPRSAQESARLAPFVNVLAANLNAEPLEDTRMLVISFSHTEPEIAASVVNMVAQVFIDRSFQTSTEKFTKTQDWLDRTTRELKGRVEQAEQELSDYTREHNLFSTDSKDTLSSDKLSRLHEQVMRAETDRILKQSLYEEVKAGRVTQLPEAFGDPKIGSLQTKLDQLAINAAQLGVKYGPDNPRVAEVKQEAAVVQQQLDDARVNLEEKLRAEYERSVREERALKQAEDRSKSEAVEQNQAAIHYSIMKQNVETAKQLYVDFLQKTNQAKVQVAEQHNNMHIVEPAQVPGSPVGPNRLRTIFMGFLLSLFGGLGLAFLLERFDNTIKTVEDVNRYAQLPALGVIPAISARMPRRLIGRRKVGEQPRPATAAVGVGQPGPPQVQLVALDNKSSAAEAYRGLRTSVLLSAAGGPPKIVMFTSGQPGEGKTTTVINTAISLAQLGASVIIVDADLRKPSTHKVFGVKHQVGLSSYLSGDMEVSAVVQKLPIKNLSLIPCGSIPPNPAELISSEKMKELLRLLAARYDHILIDSPPLMNVTDSVIMSTLVDGVILVVHGGKSTREVVRRARQELSSVGAKVFGVVLNNLDLRREGYDDYYYYYYSGYGEGAGNN